MFRHFGRGNFERDKQLEKSLEKASTRQLAALLAIGREGEPLAVIGQGDSKRELGPEAGILQIITGSPDAGGGRTEQEGGTRESFADVKPPGPLDPDPRANAEKLPAAAGAVRRDPSRSQLERFGGRRPRRLTSAVDVVGRDKRSIDFRAAALVAFFAGFVCALLLVVMTGGRL